MRIVMLSALISWVFLTLSHCWVGYQNTELIAFAIIIAIEFNAKG